MRPIDSQSSALPHATGSILKTVRVLLVEDNPGDVDLVRAYMEDAQHALGFAVDSCDRLAAALKHLDSSSYAAVILDLGLPDSQGLATFEAIHVRTPDLPILVLTGSDDIDLGLAAVQAGAADFLSKGRIDEETLIRAVRYAIERASSERRYRRLFEGSLAGVYVTSIDGTILDCNRAFAQLLGYPSRESLRACRAQDLYASLADRDAFLAKIREEGQIANYEASLRRYDGSEVWTVESARLLADADGNPTRVEGTVVDLTERREAERRQALLGSALAILNRPNEWACLIEDLLKTTKTFTRFDAIGIRLCENGDYPYVATEGFPDGFLATERSICARNEDGLPKLDVAGKPILECMCGTVIRGRTDPSLPFFTEAGSFWTNSTTELLAGTTEEERQGTTRNRCHAFGYESVGLVPVRSDGETVGLLQLNDTRAGRLTLEAIHFFEELAASIGVAYKRQQAETHIRSLLTAQTHINRLSLELGRTLDLQETYSAIYEHVRSLVDADAFVISLCDDEHGGLTPCYIVAAGERIDPSILASQPQDAMGNGMQIHVIETGEPLFVDDLQAVVGESAGSRGKTDGEDASGSALLVPMHVEGRVIGVMEVRSRRRDEYDETHAETLGGLANVSAVAIRNAQLVARIEEDASEARAMLAGTTQALSRVTETRDPYTAGHQTRVAELAFAIAEEMGLEADTRETLLTCGLLHDIGKVSVPAEILSKPTRLTDTEYALIRQHVEDGFNILKSSHLPSKVAETVVQHHERLDGSGYPHAVRGDGITLEARILAVADVVEAMSSHRPYRPALGVDAALEEIETHRGRLYDDTVVDACVRLFRQRGFEFAA